MAGKSYIKIREWDGLQGAAGPYWQRLKKMYVKTGGTTWTQVRKAYVKISDTSRPYWKKIFDTASSGVFWQNGDKPRIRLNSYRSTGYVEASPVQYMGPDYTGDSSGWPSESIGAYLYGANASSLSNIVSGNGSDIDYKYQWLWNETGNNNDDAPVSNVTSPTSDAGNLGDGVFANTGDYDRFKNSSTFLGDNNGDYWDKNFITFKVTATNSTGLQTSVLSDPVYIVRQKPTGSITMIQQDVASPNTLMSASISYSNSWYNRTNLLNSFVEWFAVDNLTDALTSDKKVQTEILNDIVGLSGGSGTTYHTPLLTNKFYFVKLTLSNSSTEDAIIPISGFTKLDKATYTSNKTVKTTTGNGPFSLTSPTKTAKFYSGSSYKRNVSINIGQSSGATHYEVQIQGQYPGNGIGYDTSFSVSGWSTIQTFLQSPYIFESNRSNSNLIASYDVTDYRNYRFAVRATISGSENGAAYNNAGTSTSLTYVDAPNVAPSQPTISNITTGTDTGGDVYIKFLVSQTSLGSNILDKYEYSLNNGTWTTGYVLSGEMVIKPVTAGTNYSVKIRCTNYDSIISAESNSLNITSAAVPADPYSVVIKSFSSATGVIFFSTGANTASVQASLERYYFVGGLELVDYKNGSLNISSNSAGKISLSGFNSSSATYTAYIEAFSGSNLTGTNSGISAVGTKTLNGNDAMTLPAAPTATNGSDARTINVTWSAGSGATNQYLVELIQGSSIISSKTTSSTSSSFTSTDGVGYSTAYTVRVTPQYLYVAGVSHDGTSSTSSSITSGSSLIAPTPTSVTFTPPRTFDVYFDPNGSHGPRYQLWWTTINGTVGGSSFVGYDAAGTGNPVREIFDTDPTVGTPYYFWLRSHNDTNIGNTTVSGSATPGTYSNWSTTNVTVTPTNLTAPTVDSVTSNGPGNSVTANLSGGTGPAFQIYWTTATTIGAGVTPDGSSDTRTVTDSTGPGSVGTWNMFARSAATTGTTASTSPSLYVSNWSAPKSFVVTATRYLYFNTNTTDGVSGMPSTQSGIDSGSGAAISIPANTPSRSGFTFAGWNTAANGTGTNYSANGSITITSDTTLFAKWTAASLTAPTISSVTWPSTAGGPISVYFSGGSGPYYQIYWMSNSDFSGVTGYDANGSSSPITDSTGPSLNGTTYYVAVRSVSALTNIGSGPSSTISSWSSSASATMSFPVIPTITMGSNTGVTSNAGTINWSSTNQASYSSDGTFSGTGTTGTSISKTGLTASTTYTGTVTVTSSTGNTASAPYSLTTSAAATAGSITVSNVSASRTATRQITGTWSSTRSGTSTSFQWWNTRIRNTSSGATATHTLFSETPRSDVYTSLTGTSYRFGVQGVIYDNSFSVYRYSIGTSDMSNYQENGSNINPA